MTQEQVIKYWKDVDELFENSDDDGEIYKHIRYVLGRRHGLEKVDKALGAVEVRECVAVLSHAVWKRLEWPEA